MRRAGGVVRDEADAGGEPRDIDGLTAWVAGRVRVAPEVLEPAVASLRECVLAWEGYRLQIATFLGVTVNEGSALSYLVTRGAMPTSELGALLGFGSGSTTLLVDRLEAKGLVQRSADPDDRRRTIVEAASATHEHLAKVAQWPAVVFGDLDAEEVAQVTRMLDLVGDRLRDFAEVVGRAESPVEPPRRRQ